jgi:hypothetical protein
VTGPQRPGGIGDPEQFRGTDPNESDP